MFIFKASKGILPKASTLLVHCSILGTTPQISVPFPVGTECTL